MDNKNLSTKCFAGTDRLSGNQGIHARRQGLLEACDLHVTPFILEGTSDKQKIVVTFVTGPNS